MLFLPKLLFEPLSPKALPVSLPGSFLLSFFSVLVALFPAGLAVCFAFICCRVRRRACSRIRRRSVGRTRDRCGGRPLCKGGDRLRARHAAHAAPPLHYTLTRFRWLYDDRSGVPAVVRFGAPSVFRCTALRTFARLDALFHAGSLRCGEPCAEFMSRLGDSSALRRAAGCALPLLHAVFRAGGLRCGEPCAEFMSRLGDSAALRRAAGCALPLLHAVFRAGGLRLW